MISRTMKIDDSRPIFSPKLGKNRKPIMSNINPSYSRISFFETQNPLLQRQGLFFLMQTRLDRQSTDAAVWGFRSTFSEIRALSQLTQAQTLEPGRRRRALSSPEQRRT